MPVITAAIDPVTRIEGHLRVDIKIDTLNGVQQIVAANTIGTLFRGFEKVLEGRDPRDAPIITSRICGVCPTAHAMVAARALDAAFGAAQPEASRLLRNLVHGTCFLESHILHFYLLCLPDYVEGAGMAPWAPAWSVGRRLPHGLARRLRAHYAAAVDVRRKVHEMGAIFGGKLPHTPAYIAGGFTAVPSSGDIASFGLYLAEITAFIRDVYQPDVEALASVFDDYFSVGRGCGNLLSFGVFDLDASGSSRLFDRGRVVAGQPGVQSVDVAAITEDVTHAWYENDSGNGTPATADTVPQHPKPGAYSWLKAPRYAGAAYECGPLARMTVNGEYANGVSVMDRHLARAAEALKLAQTMAGWLSAVPVGAGAYTPVTIPASATATGLTEAPRGALGHWLEIADHKIAHYQVVTPTCWNISPRDAFEQPGSLEQALLGVPVANADEPVEALRVIHSVDPCLDCATHVLRVQRGGEEDG